MGHLAPKKQDNRQGVVKRESVMLTSSVHGTSGRSGSNVQCLVALGDVNAHENWWSQTCNLNQSSCLRTMPDRTQSSGARPKVLRVVACRSSRSLSSLVLSVWWWSSVWYVAPGRALLPLELLPCMQQGHLCSSMRQSNEVPRLQLVTRTVWLRQRYLINACFAEPILKS